jgi:hypothetical protein
MAVIRDPSTDRAAVVNFEGKLFTISETHSLQHENSWYNENTYQVIGDVTLANATTTVLHLKNTDATRNLVISYVRVQAIDPTGGTAPPAAANYFQLGLDETVSSGGTAVTPVNVNAGSGRVADVTATDNGPTMAGTFAELDRWYLDSDGGAQTWNKEGSIILGLNDTFSVRVVSDNTGGTAYARVTFMMIERDR